MKYAFFVGFIAAVVLTGCEGPSSGYRSADFSGNKTYNKHHGTGPQLSEVEVLGIKGSAAVTDADIEKILHETRTFKVPENSSLLVVQSGSPHPDSLMVDELSRHFRVVPHTGVPSEVLNSDEGADLSKTLRLAAAHSTADTVLVYWGNLELKRNDLPTGIVSWVPVVDFMVPDEYQKVRMSLKIALLDVRTGNWTTFRTEPIEEDLVSTRYAREHNANWPLNIVKKKLYESAVRELVRGYLAGISVNGVSGYATK
jgi:hypothetical protein